MKIGVPKETLGGETRVALTPSLVAPLLRDTHTITVQRGAGDASSHRDDEYKKSSAQIAETAKKLYGESDIILKVQPPSLPEAKQFRTGSTYVGFLATNSNHAAIQVMLKKGMTAFSMEYVPRITRAQSMDALSSMATIAGYKAVLLAADALDKMFPLLMTAAGTVPPASVLVLGAGVAGLQAIATAKRLGAKVEAFDPRPAVKEQVKSLGASFIDMEIEGDMETAGGYAKEQSEQFLKKERDVIGALLPKVDAVISTAQIFGKKAPILITSKMIDVMRPGAVIIDLAAEQGGNTDVTRAGKTVERNGVKILGAVNLPATVPVHASQMYAKNLVTLVQHLFPKGNPYPDQDDEIVKGCCITRDGQIVHPGFLKTFKGGSK